MLILCPHETPATSSNPSYSRAPSLVPSVIIFKIGSRGGVEDGFLGKKDGGGEKKEPEGLERRLSG